jgi:hypothetical protein
MQALSDDEHMAVIEAKVDKLEKKVDGGFAETRTEFRAVRGEINAIHRLMIQLFCGMFLTMILGFAGIVVAMLTRV